ncbi:MAG: hypothetical protein HY812_07180 [Planctomycetes bacterium]|nr:hypothetical protein [Planctomycetota bacterium]
MVDMDKVKREVAALDTNAKILLIGSIVGIVGCLLEWYGTNIKSPFPTGVDGLDVWQGKLALVGFLVAAGTFAHEKWGKVDEAKRVLYPKVQLGGAGLAALLVLWFWLKFDSHTMGEIRMGTSFGLWLTLIAALAAAFGAFRRFQAKKT